jgi:hypothetical protein
MPSVGEIWLDISYPVVTGVKPKYLLIAAVDKYDILYCTTTSVETGRVRAPACFHGDPYAAFFLGDPWPMPPFWKPTWLDLQHYVDSLDPPVFQAGVKSGKLLLKGNLAPPLLCDALKCMRGRAMKLHAKMIDSALADAGCPP